MAYAFGEKAPDWLMTESNLYCFKVKDKHIA
jgi:hypothetical protein